MMIDVKKILLRAWHILWSYRMLWVFGFILALATGSGMGGGSGSSYRRQQGAPPMHNQRGWIQVESLEGATPGETLGNLWRFMGSTLHEWQAQYPTEFRMVITAILLAVIYFGLINLVIVVLRYVAEAASIRMVDDYEQSGLRVGFRQGFRYGWSPAAWRMFLVNFLIHLPAWGLLIFVGLIAWWILASALSDSAAALGVSLVGGIGLIFTSILIMVIIMTVLYVLRDFAWRFIGLEGAGVRASLRMAFGLIKRQWKNVGLMWLVMLGIKITWTIVLFALLLPLLVVSLLTAFGGALVAAVPVLLTAGISSLLSAPSYWPWIFAAIIGAPLFLVIAFSPITLTSGWEIIYSTSTWTLVYRELRALETTTPLNLEAGEEGPAAADG